MKYVIDHDLHIHTQLSSCSGHPEQTPKAILNYARQNGLRHICITDHFWDSRIDGASNWYKPQNYEHLAKSLPLPESSDVTFDFGCETEMDRHMTLGISHETMDKFAFIIVPTSHLHMAGFTIDENLNSAVERARFYMQRNHALLDMDLPFKKMGLAHFACSTLAINCEGNLDDILNAITDMEYAEFFERVAEKEMGVELNVTPEEATSEAVLRTYRIALNCGCKFYLGSDAHKPSEVLTAIDRFKAIVEALNLTEDDKFDFASCR